MADLSPEDYGALVGQEIGVSDWVTVDQAMIDRFADATGDHQFIHVDPERAKQTAFGGTIAHGFLTLSLFPRMRLDSTCPGIKGARMGINYGGDNVRFLAPVRSGSRVRGRFELLAFEQLRPSRFQETIGFTVELEDSAKPALTAEWIALYLL